MWYVDRILYVCLGEELFYPNIKFEFKQRETQKALLLNRFYIFFLIRSAFYLTMETIFSDCWHMVLAFWLPNYMLLKLPLLTFCHLMKFPTVEL